MALFRFRLRLILGLNASRYVGDFLAGRRRPDRARACRRSPARPSPARAGGRRRTRRRPSRPPRAASRARRPCVSHSTLRWVASCSHILTFIAGTASTGLSVARISVVPRSSAMPGGHLGHQVGGRRADDHQVGLAAELDVADLGFVLEVPQARNGLGCPLSAARLIGVTNCAPPSVRTHVTSPPPFLIRRTSSQAL